MTFRFNLNRETSEARLAKPSATNREVWTRMLYNLLRLSNDQPIDMMIYLVRQMGKSISKVEEKAMSVTENRLSIVAIDPTEPNVSTLSGLLLHLEKHRSEALVCGRHAVITR